MAYPNKLRYEGYSYTYMADPDGAAIGMHLRCKLVADAATAAIDGTAALQLASDSERGEVVTCQPIAAGAPGCCAPSNGSGGTLFGICSGTIAHGADVYAAADGKVAASGSVKLGKCAVAGVDGNICEYVPNPAAA